MSYLLKLKDVPDNRDGRFADKPLYYVSEMDGTGFWEFIPSLAKQFETAEEAFDIAAKEHSRNAFDPKDTLYIVDVESASQVEISRDKLREAAKEWVVRRKEEAEERYRQERAEKEPTVVPVIPVIHKDLSSEVADEFAGLVAS